jgi:60 kDa SS-A/Ro ribonucleoprotein
VKFNKTATGIKTVNRAGGQAYIQNPKLELVSLLLTSFVKDKFYEKEEGQLNRLRNLVFSIPDKKFVAKAAIYARTVFGMRSITHALAGELVNVVKADEWVKEAVSRIIYRPDDMTEILSYYMSNYGKPIPNNLKKGFALALEKFDSYQLAKYRGEEQNYIKIYLPEILNQLIHGK